MFSLSQEFHRARLERNQRPLVLFTLTNAFGARVYSDRLPGDEAAGRVSPPMADGTWLADGGKYAGGDSLNVLDLGARVLSFGRLRETLTPSQGEFLASLLQEEPGSVTVVLANSGPRDMRPFSRLEAQENLLGAAAEISLGYPGLKARDYLKRFQGQVVAYALEADQLTLSLRA